MMSEELTAYHRARLRLDRAFRAWACVDCDPAFAEPDEGPPEFFGPCVVVVVDGERVDHCPRCGGYGGMTADELVTLTPVRP
jgi:hypothetical protein